MSTATTEVRDLYSRFTALADDDRAQLLKLLHVSEPIQRRPTRATTAPLYPGLLYATLVEKVRRNTGRRLPALAVLGAGAIDELQRVWEWLGGEATKDQAVKRGLVELAASAAANTLRWNFVFERPQPSKAAVLSVLKNIPAAVDRAFPGYRAANLLHGIARSVSQGELPLVESEPD